MKTYAFCNQKGGVGKSTFSVHQAIRHADKGERVLFLDLDSQANSSSSLRKRSRTALDAVQLFGSDDLPNLESYPGVTLIQASTELNEVERMPNEVVTLPRQHLERYADRFDICVIDTPPSLGLRLVSALILADFVISPIELSAYSIQGIQQMLQTIRGIQGNLNPDLRFLGMLPNRVNSRSGSHREAISEIIGHYGKHIIKTPMVNRVSIQEATDSGCAVWELKTGAARVASDEMKAALNAIEELAMQEVA